MPLRGFRIRTLMIVAVDLAARDIGAVDGRGIRTMYERFTDRARKAIQLASREAERCNDEYVGTEHVLLGLIREGSGVAANVLKNLGVDLRKIRNEVEKIAQARSDMVTTGKLPRIPRAKKVIEYAIEEARNLNHNYIGTEHLLLGLLREQEGVAALVLMNLNLKLDETREEVLNLLGHGMAPPGGAALPAVGGAGPSAPSNAVSTRDVDLPSRCPKCSGARVARIHSGYSLAGLPSSDDHWRPWRTRIDGERELLGGKEPLPPNASWACLDCRPGWLDVHRLALEEEEDQRSIERNVASHDFEEAARSLNHRTTVAGQIRALTTALLSSP